MPTYQYACTACDERLEAVQSFSDAPLTECPACGGRLRKVFSAVGVVFKGSGFYKTDSRNGATSDSGGGKAEGATSDGGKSDGKAEGAKADSGKSDSGSKSGGSAASTSTGSSSASSAAKTPAPAGKSA